jgi:DNA ligase 1
MQTVLTSETLYKLDSKGKVRVWYAETGTDGTRWGLRSIAGLEDGKKVTSEWTIVEQKNVGRSNETSLEEQATSEMASEVQKKKDRGYFSDLKNIDTFDKFKPMLAEKFEDVEVNFAAGNVYAQPKLDGIRCIARKDGLWTRSGKEIVAVPHIWESLKPFFEKHPNFILDGELYNHELKDDFNTITSMVRKTKPKPEDLVKSEELVQYHIYDVIVTDEPDLSFSKRELLRYEAPLQYIRIVPTVHVPTRTGLDSLYEGYLEHGYEGQMIRIDRPYENKRTKNLLKRKEFLTDEFKVEKMLEGQGNWQGCVKHFVLKLNENTVFQAGVRGDMDTLRAMWNKGETPDWVTLRYFTPTPDGVPRFPVVIDWGKGKRED